MEEKIAKLQSRNQELRKQITALENTEIIGMIRDGGWSIEEVAALLNNSQPANPNNTSKEDF